MFYCEECRVQNDWPETFAGSYGTCELCKKEDFCHDRKSAYLPPARTVYVDEAGVHRRKSDGKPAILEDIRADNKRYQEWKDNLERVPY
jgi:hypothetical protein